MPHAQREVVTLSIVIKPRSFSPAPPDPRINWSGGPDHHARPPRVFVASSYPLKPGQRLHTKGTVDRVPRHRLWTYCTLQYISTRGKAPTLPFDDVLLAGLATDGGLYVPPFGRLLRRPSTCAVCRTRTWPSG